MTAARVSTAAVLVSIFGFAAGALGDPVGSLVRPATAPRGLQTVPVPKPVNLASFVTDEAAAIRLGKALFWDMRLGSDGTTACATCHFQAGADSRSINQVNPGADGRFRAGAPNYHLTVGNYPLRKLSDATDRGSRAIDDIDDVVASQGIFNSEFQRIVPGTGAEQVKRPFDPIFSVGGLNVRRVEPRHTPSIINAVFNHRNFWDGRAQNEFNGVNNWGDRDPDARVYRSLDSNAPPQPVRLKDDPRLRLTNASLASQAVAPIVSTLEMSSSARGASDIAAKLSRLRARKFSLTRPLAQQLVAPDDSRLGKPFSRWPEPGLRDDYATMIRAAFRREWWDSAYSLRVNDDGSITPFVNKSAVLKDNEYALMEYNFSLFFGLAIQLYESTLASDDTRYDRWREGYGTITDQEFQGLLIFLSVDAPYIDDNGNLRPGTNEGARCINCHAGPAFTDASIMTIANPDPESGTVRRKREGQEIDRGFNNIGVRPTLEDLGVGGMDTLRQGNPLSATAMCRMNGEQGTAESPCPPSASSFLAVDGAFKVPGLRNVELTAPYFHNGGHLTLESVVDFYSRGGDFGCSKYLKTPCGTADAIRAVNGTEIAPLGIPRFSSPTQGLTQTEKAALVAFLKTLTDDRVKYRKAPFDHPQIFIPHGQLNDELTAVKDPDNPGQARDRIREIPAVGKNGGSPLPLFGTYK